MLTASASEKRLTDPGVAALQFLGTPDICSNKKLQDINKFHFESHAFALVSFFLTSFKMGITKTVLLSLNKSLYTPTSSPKWEELKPEILILSDRWDCRFPLKIVWKSLRCRRIRCGCRLCHQDKNVKVSSERNWQVRTIKLTGSFCFCNWYTCSYIENDYTKAKNPICLCSTSCRKISRRSENQWLDKAI